MKEMTATAVGIYHWEKEKIRYKGMITLITPNGPTPYEVIHFDHVLSDHNELMEVLRQKVNYFLGEEVNCQINEYLISVNLNIY